MKRRGFFRAIVGGAAGAAATVLLPFRAEAKGLKPRPEPKGHPPTYQARDIVVLSRDYDVDEAISAGDPILTSTDIPDQIFVNGMLQKEGRECDYWFDAADDGGHSLHMTFGLRRGDWIALALFKPAA